MGEKGISQAVINRLPRYYRYLGDLIHEGEERISSNVLSNRMNVTASQIRQDLNHFGGFGQQGYGYNIKTLHAEIGHILGVDKKQGFIVIGAGNLGQAIANYVGFEQYGFQLKGIFDVDLAYVGEEIRGIPIRHMRELRSFLTEVEISIAALTVPRSAVDQVIPILTEGKIQGIWNFTHNEIKVPEDIKVENVHLSDSLLRLSCNLTHLAQ